MAWFKLDDKFHGWKEVLSIPRGIRAEAVGTYTILGTWSADHLTDGKIPAYMVEELGGTLIGADALVAAKLWRKSRDNYQFAKWNKDQPTRLEVEARREMERDRKAEYRRKQAESRGETGTSPDDVPPGQMAVPNTPSRPVPTRLQDQDLSGHHQLRSGSTTVDNSVETVDKYVLALESAQARLSKLTGTDVDRLTASVVVDTVLGRASKDVVDPGRYVLRAINRDTIGFERFIHEGILPE